MQSRPLEAGPALKSAGLQVEMFGVQYVTQEAEFLGVRRRHRLEGATNAQWPADQTLDILRIHAWVDRGKLELAVVERRPQDADVGDDAYRPSAGQSELAARA